MALRQAAKELNITPDQIRYWIKTAGLRTEKRENVVYLSQESFDCLQKITGLVRDGVSPAEAIRQVKISLEIVPVKREEPLSFYRIEGIEKGLLLLAEENKTLRQTIGILVEEVRGIRDENRSLKAFLCPPIEPVKPITLWQPERLSNPLDQMTWYQRAWAEIFEPWKMRKYAS
jgi:DNA-binding transcriptional MerR regulator